MHDNAGFKVETNLVWVAGIHFRGIAERVGVLDRNFCRHNSAPTTNVTYRAEHLFNVAHSLTQGRIHPFAHRHPVPQCVTLCIDGYTLSPISMSICIDGDTLSPSTSTGWIHSTSQSVGQLGCQNRWAECKANFFVQSKTVGSESQSQWGSQGASPRCVAFAENETFFWLQTSWRGLQPRNT